MKIIDLTQAFSTDFPVMTGDPKPEFESLQNIATHGFNSSRVSMCVHTGTHIDAPSHFLENGKHIGDFPASYFFGNGILIDARDCENLNFPMIDVPVLKNVKLEPHSIVLFWTGMDRYLLQNSPGVYFEKFSPFTRALAEELVKAKVRMVGMDMPSPDGDPYEIHKTLLSHECLIIENLTNLGALEGKNFKVAALPLKLPLDGAPARVIAGID